VTTRSESLPYSGWRTGRIALVRFATFCIPARQNRSIHSAISIASAEAGSGPAHHFFISTLRRRQVVDKWPYGITAESVSRTGAETVMKS
jgi:hypothetical protein